MTVVGGRTSLVDLALSSVTNTAGDFLTLSGGVVHKRTAAQTLTDIGGQAALTNPVTGTGTTNYLPKFTGASTIGNSNIQDSGTLVSVGSGATFSGIITSIVGNNSNVFTSISATTGYQAIQLANTGGNGVWVLGSSTGTNVFTNGIAYSTQIGNLGSTPLQFGTQSQINFTIFSGGNVGVNTLTDAGYKLDVNGTGRFSSSLNLGGYLTGQGNNPGGLGGSRYVLDWVSGQMRLFSYGANISTNGGFLLNSQRSDGTNSINYLDISSTGATTFSSSVTAKDTLTVTGNFPSIQLTASSGTNFYLESSFTSNRLGIGVVGSSPIMSLLSSGNVLIGTTTDAGYKLDVSGTTRVKNSSVGGSYYGQLIVEENGEAAIQLKALNYSSIYFSDAANPYEAGIVYNHIVNNLEFRGSGNSADLTISSTGAATFSSLGTGTVTATAGTLSTVSDLNFKVDDGLIDSALQKVLSLKPRYFYWNDKSGLPTDIRQLGFYAQEVNLALGEEAANTPQDKNIPWGISDRSIIAMLTKAIQELKQEIDTLKS
jgi:hypothetical protein